MLTLFSKIQVYILFFISALININSRLLLKCIWWVWSLDLGMVIWIPRSDGRGKNRRCQNRRGHGRDRWFLTRVANKKHAVNSKYGRCPCTPIYYTTTLHFLLSFLNSNFALTVDYPVHGGPCYSFLLLLLFFKGGFPSVTCSKKNVFMAFPLQNRKKVFDGRQKLQ